MAWWIWVLIALALLATEAMTTSLHIGFFALGALVAAGLDALGIGVPLWAELLIFTIVSVAGMVILRPLVMRRLKLDHTPIVDSMVGEVAVALDEIAPNSIGKAELRGTTWSAHNAGMRGVVRGERCVVEKVEGLVLFIRAQSGTA
jgi:membrane protein implicated in regulation of membrane protease activity